MTEQAVLITGASTGFGFELAMDLPKHGHVPIASMREVDGRNAEHASKLKDAGITVVEIDVGDDASVGRGVAAALDMAGRIDVLVNNAGWGLFGPLEAATPEDFRNQFETNVFGVLRMVRAVAPAMREQESGLLVHVSSGAGRLAFPGSGAYCASKWALEAMGETWRYEMAAFGIDSVIVEPGPFATEFQRRVVRVSDTDVAAHYEHLAAAQQRRGGGMQMRDPIEVVEAIVQLIDTPRGVRPTRVVIHPLKDELEALNDLQSSVQRKLLSTYRSPDLETNGL